MHRIFKRFAKNCNFRNLTQSMARQFGQKLELDFSKSGIANENNLGKKISLTCTKKGSIKSIKFKNDVIKRGSIIYYDGIVNKIIDLKSAIEIIVNEYDLGEYNEEILAYKFVKNSFPIKKNIKHLENLKFGCEITYKKDDYIFF